MWVYLRLSLTQLILGRQIEQSVFSFLIAQVVPGILVILIGYLGCDIILVLIVWFIAVTLITAGYAGAMANIVDIAPNFAGQYAYFCEYIYLYGNINIYLWINVLFSGPVLAFAQTIHMTASFLSPIAAGLLTQESVSIIFSSLIFLKI